MTTQLRPNLTDARLFEYLFQQRYFVPCFDFFSENDLFYGELFIPEGGCDTVTPIMFRDGSKAEYCDGDYTVKE